MKDNKNNAIARLKETRFYRWVNTIANSAIIGLALTLLFFAYKVYFGKKQFDETVNKLDNISQSLSTRCLGEFPVYISEINNIFASAQSHDTIVVFEDVLYYGIKSDPVGFCQLQQLLLNHSRQGGKVIVAYYDNHPDSMVFPWQTVFHRMIVESRIAPKYFSQIAVERHKRIEQVATADKNENKSLSQQVEKSREESIKRVKRIIAIDSAITEEYFILTREKDIEAAKNVVDGYLEFYGKLKKEAAATYLTDPVINMLCYRIDTIMHHYLGTGLDSKSKKITDIHFSDYEKMYSEITDCLAERYRLDGIELVPLNEYLTMGCWLIKPADKSRPVESILTFPSKYSSNEIGFYSQDKLFSNYIMTILDGVRGNMSYDKERPSNF